MKSFGFGLIENPDFGSRQTLLRLLGPQKKCNSYRSWVMGNYQTHLVTQNSITWLEILDLGSDFLDNTSGKKGKKKRKKYQQTPVPAQLVPL